MDTVGNTYKNKKERKQLMRMSITRLAFLDTGQEKKTMYNKLKYVDIFIVNYLCIM